MKKLVEYADTFVTSIAIGIGIGLGFLVITQLIGHVSISLTVQ